MPLIAGPSPGAVGVVLAIRWPSTTYSMKPAQLANAKTKPSGSPASRTSVRAATPPTASASASRLRRVRAPAAARTTVPRNSIAPTVDSGSRSTAR